MRNALIGKKGGVWFFPVKGSDVQKVNEFQLYELATHIHPLTWVDNNSKYSVNWYTWYQAMKSLQDLFKQRSLEVCFSVADELYRAINEIVPASFDDAIGKVPTGDDLTNEAGIGWQANTIKKAADKFETVLSAELTNSDTYWISPKGTHKTSMLLQYAHMALPTSVVTEMPEVKTDFDEAGKCLLFDNSTAVGFHLLRATELVIRKYYKAVTGVEPKTKFRNWGAYIKRLREHKGTHKADSKILSHLEHVRESYRNPILHPEVNLTPDEAQVLFGVCVSAIFLMANDIKAIAITAKSATPLPFTGTSGAKAATS